MAEDAVSRRPALEVESEALARSNASNRSNWAVILCSDDAIAAIILCSDDAIAAIILCSDDTIAAVILCSDGAVGAIVILCHKCGGSSENGEWTIQYYIESDLCRSE